MLLWWSALQIIDVWCEIMNKRADAAHQHAFCMLRSVFVTATDKASAAKTFTDDTDVCCEVCLFFEYKCS